MAESPPPADPADPRPWVGRRVRLGVYAAVLVAVGGWSCFHRLDRGMLVTDEAWFAYTTEHMRLTGDYVVPSIGDPGPHLNAAPLYNWLCCLTAEAFGDTALRYRAWCAASGVGCAIAALVLGALLFGPEAGLLAGLLILTNHHFLFVHGMRDGRMDPPLALLITLAVVCYVKASRCGGRGLWWWAGAGGCLGLAALMKPPAFAGFFLLLLALHHLFTRRDLGWKARLTGPVVGAAVAAAVAVPWYAAVTLRLGPDALHQLLVSNSVGRAVTSYGTKKTEEWWFYLNWVWESSAGFKLVGAAVAWGCVSAACGFRRPAWGLLLLLAVPFLAAISASATRHMQYVYPAYPVLAVMVGGLLAAGLNPARVPRTAAGRWGRAAVAVAGVAAAFVVLRADVKAVRAHLRLPRWEYPPLLVHRAAETELADGRIRLVLYKYPLPGEPRLVPPHRFSSSERIYFLKLPHAVVVRSAAELDGLLSDGRPTLVFLHHRMTASDLAAEGVRAAPDADLEMPSGNNVPYPLLSFHGAGSSVGLSGRLGPVVLRPRPGPPPAAAPPAPPRGANP